MSTTTTTTTTTVTTTNGAAAKGGNSLHIAIFPTPGMGHLIPLINLATRLHNLHQISSTFIIPNNAPPSAAQKEVVRSLPPAIDAIFLPPVCVDDLPSDAFIETNIFVTTSRSLPALRDVFKTILATKRIDALIIDLFGTDPIDIAAEFNVPTYIFYPSTAFCLSFFLHLPKLDAIIDSETEFRDLPNPIQIPGCVPIHGKDLLDPVKEKKNPAYKGLVYQTKRYQLVKGIMVNSFMDLEGPTIKTLMDEKYGYPPIYPVGPLIRPGSDSENESECLKWLDNQPCGSVIFVSFGSGGTLSVEQMEELALGLEISEQRFLWVVRSPSDGASNANYFNAQSKEDPFRFLPKGFLERTNGRGLVVPSWAPQVQVLSHSSVGGFLNHCGWNSTLESIVKGVPFIAWPLYAEQKMNVVLLCDDLKVALRPKFNAKGVVERDEIAKVVKALMEGEEGKVLRSRMKNLKDAAAKALSEDGSSTKSLNELVLRWKNHESL